MTNDIQILRRPAVEKMVGLSCATIYRRMNAGDFPRPIKLSSQSVGWRRRDIELWLAARPEAA